MKEKLRGSRKKEERRKERGKRKKRENRNICLIIDVSVS